ncbi:DUF1737 domain-containing protein [Mariniflexile gromovii]|uniref:DUF1737 domain-containing protein n=1 Tax=Mariniflexile gromovii TaxID=362523 RepID=A0ABS4BSJ7_9FLAO|nr:DUF1737 domain-containing protein [Mariniflexile gromovii]
MKIKILESDSTPKFEERINQLLKKGWKIKGNLFRGKDCLTAIMCKN